MMIHATVGLFVLKPVDIKHLVHSLAKQCISLPPPLYEGDVMLYKAEKCLSK